MDQLSSIPDVVTAELDSETPAIVEQVACDTGMKIAEFAAEAVRCVAESEADYRAFVQVGVDAADRGDLAPHEEIMAELDAMIEKHRVRCSG